MMDIKKNFGKKLKDLRIKNNFTQEYVAEKIGLQSPTVSRVENGKSFVSYEVLQNICILFDVEPVELFDYEEITHDGTDKQIIQHINKKLKRLNSKGLKQIYKILCILSEE